MGELLQVKVQGWSSLGYLGVVEVASNSSNQTISIGYPSSKVLEDCNGAQHLRAQKFSHSLRVLLSILPM